MSPCERPSSQQQAAIKALLNTRFKNDHLKHPKANGATKSGKR